MVGGMHGSKECRSTTVLRHSLMVGWVCVAGETATAADGTQPTGMHSCFFFSILFLAISNTSRTDTIHEELFEVTCSHY